MSGYEIPLFVVGLVIGILVGVLFSRLLRLKKFAAGSVSISQGTCITATRVRLQGTVAALDDPCIGLYSFDYPASSTANDSSPPAGATTQPTPPPGSRFNIQHTVQSDPTQPYRVVVWAAFGQYNHNSWTFDPPCGSGSGSGSGGLFMSGRVVAEPAPRFYRLVVEDEPPGAVELGLTPDVRRALSRRDVTLAYDELETTPCAATWTEAGAAADTLRWRLTLRKTNGVFVAALELVGDQHTAGPTLTWQSRQWHVFGRSRFAAPGDSPVARRLPGLGVEPA